MDRFIKVYNDEVKALINVDNLNAVTVLDNGESIKLFYSTGNDIAFPFIGKSVVDEIFNGIEKIKTKGF